MRNGMTMSHPDDPTLTRRGWLLATLLGGGLFLRGSGPVPAADDVADELAQIQEQARKAGMGSFRSSVTEHYLGIGDAPDLYRDEALKRCRALATAYQKYFQEKKFNVV